MKLVSSLDSLLVSGTDRSFVIDTLVSTLLFRHYLLACRKTANKSVEMKCDSQPMQNGIYREGVLIARRKRNEKKPFTDERAYLPQSFSK